LVGELDSSFPVTFQGERHVAAGTSGCVDDRYQQYLLHPETGFSDLYCPKVTGLGKKIPRSLGLPKVIRRW
jgi:hypothetical protein